MLPSLTTFVLVAVIAFGFVIRFHNNYQCEGDWGTCYNNKQISSEKQEDSPDRLDICIKEGFGTCLWEIGLGTTFSDPWFKWETKYIGEWKENKKHGKGIYYSMSGTKYDGNWENDQREGFGTLILRDQEAFVSGIWRNDQLTETNGILQRSNTIRYKGHVKEALMHGTGKLSLDRFSIFGRFVNGSLHTDVGEISTDFKLFTIHHWENKWEWTLFKTNATVSSIVTGNEYCTNENGIWILKHENNNIQHDISGDPVLTEISILEELSLALQDFEMYFLHLNMQIIQKPYQFE